MTRLSDNAPVSGADPALAVPAEPASRLGPSGFDRGEGFTPGPWHVERGHDEDGAETETLHICHPGTVCENTTVCQVWDDAEANARLIAAAPELYEALDDILIHCLADIEAEEQKDEPNETALALYRARRDRAQAALAKARGEA